MELETIFTWPPTPAKWRGLKGYLSAQKIVTGKGLLSTKGSTGILLRVAKKDTPPPAPSPFEIYDASTTVGGTTTLKVGITPGYVNGISPEFTGATAGEGGTLLLSSSPAPLLTITANTYFWLKCVGTFGDPDSYVVTIHNEATYDNQTEEITGTGFTSYKYMGSAVVSSGSITAIGSLLSANQWVESYGSLNVWANYS